MKYNFCLIVLTSIFASVALGQESRNVEQLSFVNSLGRIGQVYYSQGMLYILQADSGLSVFDVHDPANPNHISSFKLSGGMRWFQFRDSLVFVGSDSLGLNARVTVLNIGDPNAIRIVSQVETSEPFVGICLIDSILYLASRYAIEMVSVADVTNPVEIGSYFIEGYPVGVFKSRSFLLVTRFLDNGIQLYDVTDPLNPDMLSIIENPGDGILPFCDQENVYLPDRSDGLRIYDLSDPMRPEQIGIYDTEGTANGVAVKDNCAFLADGLNGMRVIEINDLEHCNEIGFYLTSTAANQIALGDSGVVFVVERNQLDICRYTPENSVSDIPLKQFGFDLQLYPTPFNSSAQVTFTLPIPGKARILVLDQSGRKVVQLADGFFTAGPHSFAWQSGSLPSGTYYVHGNFDGESLMTRVVMVK